VLYLAVKAALLGVIIVVVSRRSPTLGALILPCLWFRSSAFSGCGMIPVTPNGWPRARMTFSCVLPTFPIFLMPALLRHGIGFWSTLAALCMLTFVLYIGTIRTLGKYEMTL